MAARRSMNSSQALAGMRKDVRTIVPAAAAPRDERRHEHFPNSLPNVRAAFSFAPGRAAAASREAVSMFERKQSSHGTVVRALVDRVVNHRP
jgi:hypothetical protein